AEQRRGEGPGLGVVHRSKEERRRNPGEPYRTHPAQGLAPGRTTEALHPGYERLKHDSSPYRTQPRSAGKQRLESRPEKRSRLLSVPNSITLRAQFPPGLVRCLRGDGRQNGSQGAGPNNAELPTGAPSLTDTGIDR